MMLKNLQTYLREHDLQALLVTRNNMFLGEDVRPTENLLWRLTGFSGSAGLLLITQKSAYLFADGRYRIQARQETDEKSVTVIDVETSFREALAECLKNLEITTLAGDFWCLSIAEVHFLQQQGLTLLDWDSADLAEKSDKPIRIFELPTHFAGKTRAEKCAQTVAKFSPNIDAVLLCSADDVSWLLNLRSDALDDTPILRAFALLNKNKELEIFADGGREYGLKPLSALAESLSRYAGRTILTDNNTTPQKILSLLPKDTQICNVPHTPVALLKSLKNPTELTGFQNAHIRDGVAVSRFLYWLESNAMGLKESDVVRKLHEFRAQEDLFVSESFGTIAATGTNAAIVHYQPTPKTDKTLEENSLLLLDSGGQYYDGTTDVTRTVALGTPSAEMKDSFTQVLKAHIALASHLFAVGTSGATLDAVARNVLKSYGKDYAHGTGHGVGHFLNVHEGPFRIGAQCKEPVQADMVMSVEPGYYVPNAYGIRIENLVYTLHDKQTGLLKFQNLTVIPIDKRLINPYLLTREEQAYLNNYHQQVWNCLAPRMNETERQWLKEACSPL